jgi:hypothetical protein
MPADKKCEKKNKSIPSSAKRRRRRKKKSKIMGYIVHTFVSSPPSPLAAKSSTLIRFGEVNLSRP